MSTLDRVSEKNTLEQENNPDKEKGIQESNHVSMSAQELTPFERKAALVNALVILVSGHSTIFERVLTN